MEEVKGLFWFTGLEDARHVAAGMVTEHEAAGHLLSTVGKQSEVSLVFIFLSLFPSVLDPSPLDAAARG